MRLVAKITVGFVICASIFGQDPNEEARAKQGAEQLAKAQKNWGGKMNSPGATISIKEMSRRKAENHTAVIYRLFASGMPKDKVYSIIMTSFDLRPTPALEGVTLDESGQAICAGRPGTCSGDKPNDPIDLVLLAARGEPKRFALISDDGEIKAFAYVLPFPIVGVDRGCSVEAILLTQNAEAVLIHGSGFEPDSYIHFIGQSKGETQQGDSKADAAGDYYQVQLPYVKGKSKGTARVTLKSKTCSPSLSYDWGKDSYQIQ